MRVLTIRPLCPTRWLCRAKAIKAVFDNYKNVLESLDEIKKSGNSDTADKAHNLALCFGKGETYLRLLMAIKPLTVLEQLNRSFQARSANISGKP